MTPMLFLVFFILMIIGVPIAVCLGLSAIITIAVSTNVPLIISASTMFSGIDSFPLMAIPFFILAGNMMSEGGISKRLINFANIFVGKLTGGLAIVAIVSAMFFAAISGSSPATTAAIGGVMLPAMKKDGYDDYFAGATVAAAGTVGIVIPPSISMVLYSVLAGTSIDRLFLAGFGPGVVMGLAMILYAYVYAKKHNLRSDKPRPSLLECFRIFIDSFWALLMPVVILGGIYRYFYSDRICSCSGVLWSVCRYFHLQGFEGKDLPKILCNSASATAVIMIIMGAAGTFGWLLAREHIPQVIASGLLSMTTNKYILLLLFNVILLIAGCFLNASAAIVLLTPILLPILTNVGLNPYLIGIIMVVNLAIGQITPPVGACLYVACNVGNLNFEKLIKETMPYLLLLLVALMLITYVEPVSLFLVRLFYGAV